VLPLVPGADYASTSVYRLGDGADVSKLFDVSGWAMRIFQLR
jgi:hypothetical protein